MKLTHPRESRDHSGLEAGISNGASRELTWRPRLTVFFLCLGSMEALKGGLKSLKGIILDTNMIMSYTGQGRISKCSERLLQHSYWEMKVGFIRIRQAIRLWLYFEAKVFHDGWKTECDWNRRTRITLIFI